MTSSRAFTIKNPYVLIDGHDFSNLVKSATVTLQKDENDTTSSGDLGHTQQQGLSKDSFAFNLYQDKDLSILDRVLYDIYDAESAVVVEVASQGSTVSEANPSWTGNAKLFTYAPLAGDVGSIAMVSPTFVVDGKITRAGT